MQILLVEDHAADAAAIAESLRHLGHTVAISKSGNDALEQYTKRQPDLVVVSAFVPGIDGFALTEAIQQHAGMRWQPVIVISSECDETLQARAIEAGADAFFVKPVATSSLVARLAVIERLLKLQDEAEARLAQIGHYMAAEEADLRIARHLIEHQMTPDGARQVDDPAVQYWQRSCPRLGGDMLSICRTPSGVLHVMLADASMGGLSAYVSLLPVIAPFQRMTEKGYSLATIARELNHKVRQVLPANRSVAAQLIAVDMREGVVSVWNGGMPPAFMLDGHGHHFQEFSVSHPALGMLDEATFDDRLGQHAFSRGEQLVMVSDGLLDATGLAGERFGEQGLANALVGIERRQRRGEVVAAVTAHLDGQVPNDDMTLVLIDCERGATRQGMAVSGMPRTRDAGHWRFDLQVSAHELVHLDAVPILLDVAAQFDMARARSGELFVILSELFNNALDHGVLRLDSRLKLSHDGLEDWLKLREERLARLAEGEIGLSVEHIIEAGHPWLRIHCRDSGPGFDVHAVMSQQGQGKRAGASELPFGRGLTLVRRMSHSMEFDARGNQVTVMMMLDRNQPLPH